jgi:uncharacterized membrane protein YfhO
VLTLVDQITKQTPDLPSVVLEYQPDLNTLSSGIITVQDINSDRFVIDADMSTPGFIVITDPYSINWHAEGDSKSAQSEYDIVHCDWALMAIPVRSGHHHITLYYEPPLLKPALIISTLSWIAVITLLGFTTLRRSNINPNPTSAAE